MEELRVGIVGSRRRNSLYDRSIVFGLIETLVQQNPHRRLVIVSGACPKGADSFAAESARSHGLGLVEYPVPPVKYGSKWEFRQAAFSRNRLIAEDSHVGFALVSEDRTGGTENTIAHYVVMEKNVFIVERDGNVRYLSGVAVPSLLDPDRRI